MINAELYERLFLYIIIIFTLISCLLLNGLGYAAISKGSKNSQLALLLTIVFSLFIGFRPLSAAFGDSWVYNYTYELMKSNIGGAYETSSEWIWSEMMYFCSQTVDVSIFFTLVSLGYFGFTLLACKTLTPNNVLVSLLFCLGAFSFYTYATNGIRNGLACSILLYIIALCTKSVKRPIVILLIFVVFNIHRSSLLPLASLFASIYVVKSYKWAYTFWLLSIIISLVAGGFITSIFAGLGFDDRLSYLTSTGDSHYTKTYFRWDFLIYSMMPMILGYYVVIKRGIQDKTYLILLNTYTLANAFWVMVIRANYSNRFAYLSWFMYPLVLAYPLLKLNIWGNQQGKRATQIMLAHVGFTWFMLTIF